MILSKEEQARYSRHLLMQEIGEEGQIKLKFAKVLVIGAGGLGCPILQYLAAAGVGNIGVVDMDKVDESNLQRQILYTVADIGVNKAEAAKKRLQGLNPFINIQVYPVALDNYNALEIMEQYDLVIDGSDNFATRYLVNDACVLLDKPLVYGSIFKFEGQVSVFNYKNGPTYRCLFPEPPLAGEVPNCSEIGVLGVLPGIIGSMQANEALKIILEIGEVLSGKLLLYNALNAQSLTLEIVPNLDTIAKTKNIDLESMDYEFFCGVDDKDEALHSKVKEISSRELVKNLDKYILLDVRELWELPRYEELKTINIPLPRLIQNIEQIPKNQPVVVICAKGIRSKIAIELLQDKFGYTNLENLAGGMEELVNNGQWTVDNG